MSENSLVERMRQEGMPLPFVGQRVEADDGQRAVVRYVGALAVRPGDEVWIGVEWDDPRRGKHNGEQGGERYFACERPGAGSFVKMRRLRPSRDAVRAVRWRYGGELEASSGMRLEDGSFGEMEGAVDDMHIWSTRDNKLPVEFVGREKILKQQGNLTSLRVISLADERVDSAGPPGALNSTVPGVEELDLSSNLLLGWDAVVPFFEELPRLQVLKLMNMRLAWPTEHVSGISFTSLTVLILNKTGVSWNQIEKVEPSLPNLSEVHVCENAITHFRSDSAAETGRRFQNLKLVNADDNLIADWSEVAAAFEDMTSLLRLYLNGNAIPSVSYGGAENFPKWRSLNCLLMARNKIDAWESINELNLFPTLSELRLTQNPIMEAEAGSKIQGLARVQMIARISSLSSLNGSEIKSQERVDCERRYIRYCLDEVMPTTGPRPETLPPIDATRHPRFAVCVEKHGLPSVSKAVSGVGDGSLASELVSVRITCVAASVGEKPARTKRIPKTLTLHRFKMMCEAFFKIKPSEQIVYYRTSLDPVPIAIDGDDETLSYLGIEEGHEILIDKADEVLAKREAEKQSVLERKLRALAVEESFPMTMSSNAHDDN